MLEAYRDVYYSKYNLTIGGAKAPRPLPGTLTSPATTNPTGATPVVPGAFGNIGKTTEESVRIKLSGYLLNPTHPQGGPKAKWFEKALGFAKNNLEDLAKQIIFDPKTAKPITMTSFGQKYHRWEKCAENLCSLLKWIKFIDSLIL